MLANKKVFLCLKMTAKNPNNSNALKDIQGVL